MFTINLCVFVYYNPLCMCLPNTFVYVFISYLCVFVYFIPLCMCLLQTIVYEPLCMCLHHSFLYVFTTNLFVCVDLKSLCTFLLQIFVYVFSANICVCYTCTCVYCKHLCLQHAFVYAFTTNMYTRV